MASNSSMLLHCRWLGALAGLALLAGCDKPGEPVLGRVGAREFRAADLKAEAEFRLKHRRPVPDRDALLRELMTQEALLQRARQTGVADDFAVRRELDNLLVAKLWDREVAARTAAVTVTDEELRKEYERNLARYTQPPQVRLAMLQLNGGRVMSDAKRAELRARMAEARTKAIAQPMPEPRGASIGGFGPLAAEYSEDVASRFRGGDLGWIDPTSNGYHWPAAVLQAGYALPRGQVSEIIEAGGSLYLVMKTDERKSTVTPFAQVQAGLRQSVLQRKRQALEAAFREESLARAKPFVDAKALATVELPSPKAEVASAPAPTPPAGPDGPTGRSFAP
jgi:peptidyl-prolyl cis-trans isomerase C